MSETLTRDGNCPVCGTPIAANCTPRPSVAVNAGDLQSLTIQTADLCGGRPNLPHCDHETGSTTIGHRVTERIFTCCHCNRGRHEEVLPPKSVGSFTYKATNHGPFAPPTWYGT